MSWAILACGLVFCAALPLTASAAGAPDFPGASWTTIYEENEGCCNSAANENDPIRHLYFPNKPAFTDSGDYWVRFTWKNSGDRYAQFRVPQGKDIFKQAYDPNIPITDVTGDHQVSGQVAGNAKFCHACYHNAPNNMQWGDTCWAITPASDNNRQCGCCSGGWSGRGVYYGGKKNPHVCGGQGGGFTGSKQNGQQKGNLPSLGLVISVAPTGCQQGQFLQAGAGCQACTTSCPAGQYFGDRSCGSSALVLSTLDNTCLPCPEGSKCAGGTSQPELCGGGFFQQTPGQSDCSPCGNGSHTGQTGATECVGILAGYYGTGGAGDSHTGVAPCEPGNYCPGGALDEIPCHEGMYAAEPKLVECASCLNFTGGPGYQTQRGAKSCTVCAAGDYLVSPAQAPAPCPAGSKCELCKATPCTPGTYQTRPGFCDNCQQGTFQPNSNATACLPVTDCKPGEAVAEEPSIDTDRRCTACPVGQFTTATNAAKCTPCDVCEGGSVVSEPCLSTSNRECASSADAFCTDGARAAADPTLCGEGRPGAIPARLTDAAPSFVTDGPDLLITPGSPSGRVVFQTDELIVGGQHFGPALRSEVLGLVKAMEVKIAEQAHTIEVLAQRVSELEDLA